MIDTKINNMRKIRRCLYRTIVFVCTGFAFIVTNILVTEIGGRTTAPYLNNSLPIIGLKKILQSTFLASPCTSCTADRIQANKTKHCFDILKSRGNWSKHRAEISCQGNKSELVTKTKANPIIYNISYGDPCLEKFIQDNCYDGNPVPNVVHYVWFSKHIMDIYSFLSVLSASKFLKPCLILFHADYIPYGPYWLQLLRLVPNVVHVHRRQPETIFGKKFGFIQHKSDVARIEALTDYGGIYLDSDQLVLKSFDKFRKHEFVMGHENKKNLGNSVIISKKNATFLRIWHRNYRTYNPRQWGIHSTFVPFTLAKIYPKLIHIENDTFIKPDLGGIEKVYTSHFNWSENYAIHLYTRWVRKFYTFDQFRTMDSAMGEIARFIMYGSQHLCDSS